MATIIKSVSFQNFYNYYGGFEQNTYNFKEGINIVNADNNMGKSKFYNGILWILKDTVYDSDHKRMIGNASVPRLDSHYFKKMASGKALSEETNFQMGVNITFLENKDKYSVSKTVHFEKGSNDWKTNEKIEVLQTIDNKDIPILGAEDKTKIIQKIIPVELMNYALLQGESMETIVDFSKHDSLTSTINTLAGISNLTNICTTSKALSRSAGDLYKKKFSESKMNFQKVEELIQEQNELEKRIDSTTEQIEVFQTELSDAKNKKEALEALQLYATKRGEYREKLKNLNGDISSLKGRKSEKEKNITAMLFSDNSPWILMGLEKQISDFDKNRIAFSNEVATQKAVKNTFTMMPINSPDTLSLKRMIDARFCEICNREAPDESVEHMKKLYERPVENNSKNDFSAFYSNIQTTVGSFSLSILKNSKSIQEYRDKIDKIETLLAQKEEEKDTITQEFFNAGGNSEDSDLADRKNKSDYTLATNTIEKKTDEIQKAENFIKQWKIKLKQNEDSLKIIDTDSKTKDYSDFRDTMCCVESIFLSTKERIFNEILNQLEVNANQKYNDLTQGNLSAGGKLNFTKQADGTVQVSIKNINDGELTGLGTGFQRMKQLSIIMAIISSKIGNKQFNYPFISDAPFSEFGDNFINNFFKIAPNVFKQSIIFIKELYEPNSENYLNDLGKKILRKMKNGDIQGTFYVNVIEDKADTTNLITKNKCYKY